MINHDDSLEWLARRYVLGELEADEMATFEARLADDDQAAAAVADAARLVLAIQAAQAVQTTQATLESRTPPTDLSARRHLPNRPWAARIAVGIAGLAAAVAFVWVLPRGGDEAAELAARWAEIPEVVPADDAAEDEEADGDDVPDWLLAAVTLEQDEIVREN